MRGEGPRKDGRTDGYETQKCLRKTVFSALCPIVSICLCEAVIRLGWWSRAYLTQEIYMQQEAGAIRELGR